MNGWIKIHRKMVNWEWYHDQNVRLVFLHMLLKANFKAKKWCGTTIQRGQFITSIGRLSKEIGLSNQQIRTALEKLKSTGEITTKATNKYTMVTVENYALYQDVFDDENDLDNNEETNMQQSSNDQITTTEEIKKEKNDKKDEEVKNKERRFTPDDRLNDAIIEFAKMRKLMKKPMTDRAFKLMLAKLNQMTIDTNEQVDIINQSIMNGWLGIFPLKDKHGVIKSNNPFLDMLKKGE